MYGQTNCWLGPDVQYIAFRAKNDEIFIATERSAKSMFILFYFILYFIFVELK